MQVAHDAGLRRIAFAAVVALCVGLTRDRRCSQGFSSNGLIRALETIAVVVVGCAVIGGVVR